MKKHRKVSVRKKAVLNLHNVKYKKEQTPYVISESLFERFASNNSNKNYEIFLSEKKELAEEYDHYYE